jgi:hypothetical protein
MSNKPNAYANVFLCILLLLLFTSITRADTVEKGVIEPITLDENELQW